MSVPAHVCVLGEHHSHNMKLKISAVLGFSSLFMASTKVRGVRRQKPYGIVKSAT